jgi:hypothetical protein
MNLDELKKVLDERTEELTFTHSEIMIMHVTGCLMDGRRSMAKFLKKHFSPVALSLNRKYPEYASNEKLKQK